MFLLIQLWYSCKESIVLHIFYAFFWKILLVDFDIYSDRSVPQMVSDLKELSAKLSLLKMTGELLKIYLYKKITYCTPLGQRYFQWLAGFEIFPYTIFRLFELSHALLELLIQLMHIHSTVRTKGFNILVLLELVLIYPALAARKCSRREPGVLLASRGFLTTAADFHLGPSQANLPPTHPLMLSRKIKLKSGTHIHIHAPPIDVVRKQAGK